MIEPPQAVVFAGNEEMAEKHQVTAGCLSTDARIDSLSSRRKQSKYVHLKYVHFVKKQKYVEGEKKERQG